MNNQNEIENSVDVIALKGQLTQEKTSSAIDQNIVETLEKRIKELDADPLANLRSEDKILLEKVRAKGKPLTIELHGAVVDDREGDSALVLTRVIAQFKGTETRKNKDGSTRTVLVFKGMRGEDISVTSTAEFLLKGGWYAVDRIFAEAGKPHGGKDGGTYTKTGIYNRYLPLVVPPDELVVAEAHALRAFEHGGALLKNLTAGELMSLGMQVQQTRRGSLQNKPE